MKKILLAALFAVTGTNAMAQSNFKGAYGQVGIGYSSATIDHGSGSGSTLIDGETFRRSHDFQDTSDFTGTVTVGYMGIISKHFLLGIGSSYSPIAGSNKNIITLGGDLSTSISEYKVQNSYNIFLSPAMAIDTNKLIYGKVGYSGMSVKVTYTGSNNPTTKYKGCSFGLGYRQIIKGGLYGFAEGNYFSYGNQTTKVFGTISGIAYSTSTTVNANAYNFLVGIGYKF